VADLLILSTCVLTILSSLRLDQELAASLHDMFSAGYELDVDDDSVLHGNTDTQSHEVVGSQDESGLGDDSEGSDTDDEDVEDEVMGRHDESDDDSEGSGTDNEDDEYNEYEEMDEDADEALEGMEVDDHADEPEELDEMEDD
jgi:hypothetical protein